ncbi:hypothetical protein LAZ67_X004533 [Cordylochernes scorpioides]|uniref:Mos1 transposase HTH domain-containing protein n=1 Tax=Cordylochernes scorpioides TaxID=51811 RepID=A0ABY6LVH0_9ARAC|nr:hypothetical protein LAZ67_X004533 [Cordylochernes scorpioides]
MLHTTLVPIDLESSGEFIFIRYHDFCNMGGERLTLQVEQTIRTLSKEGNSYSVIVKKLKAEGLDVGKATICRVVNGIGKKREAESNGQKFQVDRPRPVRTPATVSKVKRLATTENPPSQRQLSRMCGTSLKTINNIIHKDLELDTRRKGKVHKLTPFHMKNRATNARKLYEEHLAGSRSEYTATLDEAWMYVTYCNGIRKICYIKRGNQVPDNWVHQCSETFPKGFMVVGVMTGRGVLPLIKVPSKVKVNSEFYIECVLKPVIEQLKDLYPGEMDKVFLHHDKASSHTSNKTQQFLQEMKDTLGLNFIRNSDIPVKSPDASPLDFYGFGMLKQRLFNRRPKTEAGLWKAAQEEWSNVSLSKVKEVFAAWKVRCREIAKKKGKHIEHMKKIHETVHPDLQTPMPSLIQRLAKCLIIYLLFLMVIVIFHLRIVYDETVAWIHGFLHQPNRSQNGDFDLEVRSEAAIELMRNSVRSGYIYPGNLTPIEEEDEDIEEDGDTKYDVKVQMVEKDGKKEEMDASNPRLQEDGDRNRRGAGVERREMIGAAGRRRHIMEPVGNPNNLLRELDLRLRYDEDDDGDDEALFLELTVFLLWVLKEDKKQESSKMETNEIRAVIKFLCKKGMSPKEIYEDMVDTLREDVSSYSTVNKWIVAFKLGRISTEEEHRPGRPVESVTQENIDKIHILVMLDSKMTIRQIEETLGIPKTTVDWIMREHLGLRKLSARWVPKLLTPDQKAVRRKLFSDNLRYLKPIQRNSSVDLLPWMRLGPITLHQSPSNNPCNGDTPVPIPPRKPRQFHQQGRKIVYHQDNAPSLRSQQAMATIYDSGFELLPHAPYSPDLAPSDFHLFPHLKKSLSGIHFSSDEEVIDAVTSFFKSLETSLFLEGIKALEHRWKNAHSVTRGSAVSHWDRHQLDQVAVIGATVNHLAHIGHLIHARREGLVPPWNPSNLPPAKKALKPLITVRAQCTERRNVTLSERVIVQRLNREYAFFFKTVLTKIYWLLNDGEVPVEEYKVMVGRLLECKEILREYIGDIKARLEVKFPHTPESSCELVAEL